MATDRSPRSPGGSNERRDQLVMKKLELSKQRSNFLPPHGKGN